MKDRLKFRCGVTFDYTNSDTGVDYEIQIVIENADLCWNQECIGFSIDDIEELIKAKIKGTEHEDWFDCIMDDIECNNQNSCDCEYIIWDYDWIEQCTGLKDINKKLMYEGDIVKKLEKIFIDVKELSYQYSKEELENIYGKSINIKDVISDSINNNERFYEVLAYTKTDMVTFDNLPVYWLKDEEFGYEGEKLESPEDWEIFGNIYEEQHYETSKN